MKWGPGFENGGAPRGTEDDDGLWIVPILIGIWAIVLIGIAISLLI